MTQTEAGVADRFGCFIAGIGHRDGLLTMGTRQLQAGTGGVYDQLLVAMRTLELDVHESSGRVGGGL
jgi:hypothetical protein